MPSTERRTRRIDTKLPDTGGGAIIPPGGASTPGAPPVVNAPGAPQNVRIVDTFLLFSAVAPIAGANVAWTPPAGTTPTGYVLQWATTSGFAAPTTRVADGSQTTAALDGMPPGVTVYVRVAAIAYGLQGSWSATASATTPSDTAPPAAVGSLTTLWSGATGDLTITWPNPTSANLRDVRVRIYASNGGALLREAYSASGQYVWTLGQHLADTSGTPDPSVYLVLTARSWSNVLSTDFAGTATLTPPANVTGATATWDSATGDCTFRWTAVANAAGYRLTIDGVTRTLPPLAEYVYPLGLNRVEHGGTADPTLTWSLVAADALGQISATPATGTATLAAPATPTGLTSSWAGDTGTAAAGCVITWTALAGVARYRLSIDGNSRDVFGGRFVYDLDSNTAEHAGTPDPVLSLSLVAVDALGQTSTAATATATNAAPPATTLTVFGAFSLVGLTIAASAAADIKDYRVRVYRNSTLVRTLFTADLSIAYTVEDGSGSYTFDVAARDLFGQIGTASSQTGAVAMTDMAQYVAELRSGLLYADSLSTAATTLAGLKDGDLTANVVTYTGNNTWRWTQGDWQEEITHQTTEIALSSTASVYIGTSPDGVTWTWFSGGTAAGGRWQPVSAASESAAQTAATALTAGVWRVDLPAPRRCRYIRIGHRHASTNYALREFFPSTLLRGTYVQAESITAVQIAAGAIVADKIAVGALDGYVLTGATVRTAASGERVVMDSTGLRTYDSAGNVVIEATTATDGALKAGAGGVTLDRNGLNLIEPLLGNWQSSPGSFVGFGGTSADPGAVITGGVGFLEFVARSGATTTSFGIDTVSKALNVADSVSVGRFLRQGGTAFPASPANNDLYYRTDLDWWCVYDGTRWLTCQTFELRWSLATASVTEDVFATLQALPGDYLPWLTRWDILVNTGATNNASNYWQVFLRYGGAQTLASVSTAALPASGSEQRQVVTSFTQLPAVRPYLNLSVAKTGAPSNLGYWSVARYRLVVT